MILLALLFAWFLADVIALLLFRALSNHNAQLK